MTLAATTNDGFRRIYIRRDNPIAKLIFAVREELGGDAGIIVGVVASERSLLRRNTGKTVFALKTAASYYKYYYMYPKVLSDEDSWELAFDSVVFDLEALDAKLSSGDEKQIIICDDIGRWFPRRNVYTKDEREILGRFQTFRLLAAGLIWTTTSVYNVPTRILIETDIVAFITRHDRKQSIADFRKPYVIGTSKIVFQKTDIPNHYFTVWIPDSVYYRYVRERISRFGASANPSGEQQI